MFSLQSGLVYFLCSVSLHTATNYKICAFLEMNFVDILYQMLRDHDPQVVSNCIAALSEILASEGGMVVNTKIAHYLLNRLV